MFIFSCFIYYKCIKFYILFDCSILSVVIESVRCYDDAVELINSAIRLTWNFFSMRAGTKNERECVPLLVVSALIIILHFYNHFYHHPSTHFFLQQIVYHLTSFNIRHFYNNH